MLKVQLTKLKNSLEGFEGRFEQEEKKKSVILKIQQW